MAASTSKSTHHTGGAQAPPHTRGEQIMTPTQVSVQLTDATMEQIEYLKRCGFGTRTDIVRMAIQDRYQNEREERGNMNDEMVNISPGTRNGVK